MKFVFPPAPVIQTCGAQSSLWTPCCKELPPTRHPPPPLHLREAQLRGEVQKHTRIQIETHTHTLANKYTDMLACKQLKTSACTCTCIQANAHTERRKQSTYASTYTHRASPSFRGYQRDIVSRSSALINLSDVPCCSQPPER